MKKGLIGRKYGQNSKVLRSFDFENSICKFIKMTIGLMLH